MLKVHNLTGGYNDSLVIENISFEVNKGEIFGIVGPNGSGKTTMMKMITNSLEPTSGEILLENKPLTSYSTKEIAKIMAVLPQHSSSAFSYTVEEIVMLGRYPYHKGIFHTITNRDEQIVTDVMKQTGIYQYKNQSLDVLSGGERQRVMLARALAQEPKLLLLDEPTNHLDISYQIALLDLLKEWTKEKQLTVIAILHDLNMASLYCDQVLLLDEGKMVDLNKPQKVMEEKQLEAVYETRVRRKEHPTVPSPLITLVPKMEEKLEQSFIHSLQIEQNEQYIKIESPKFLKTLSSSVIGAGFGWEKVFINRHVSKNYYCDDVELEFIQYIETLGIDHEETIGMMTAAILEDVCFETVEHEDFSLLVAVTAGISNAVDASKAYLQDDSIVTVGTINTWIFIDGKLSDAAFVQAMVTATEAKVKAMQEKQVIDPVMKTIATGTSTDSISIAATQAGRYFPYAGTITPLGRNLAKAVFEATKNAIEKNKERWKVE